MEAYVYETINLVNGMKYIGCHKSKEFDENYKGSGVYLWRAIEKYGWDSFETHIIKEFDTLDEALEYEAIKIEEVGAVQDSNYYNLIPGGRTGWSQHLSETVRMTDGSNNIMVNPKLIPAMKELGFHLGLTKALPSKTRKGTYWMTDGINEIWIDPSRYDEYVKLGWWRGRRLESIPCRGFRYEHPCWVTNGITDHYARIEDLDYWESQGFHRGRSKGVDTGSQFKSDMIWVTNGKDSFQINKSELDSYISKGYRRGITRKLRGKRIFINNGKKEFLIKPEELESYESQGYTKGRISHYRK